MDQHQIGSRDTYSYSRATSTEKEKRETKQRRRKNSFWRIARSPGGNRAHNSGPTRQGEGREAPTTFSRYPDAGRAKGGRYGLELMSVSRGLKTGWGNGLPHSVQIQPPHFSAAEQGVSSACFRAMGQYGTP